MAYIALMDSGPDLLTTMNECIVKNKEIGLYDGCKNAVELAMQLASEGPSDGKAGKAKAKSPAKKRPSASPARSR